MTKRRDFIKASVAMTAGAIATRVSPALAAGSSFPQGIIYTKEQPGKWAKKVGSHAPIVSVDGKKVTIETKHGMSEKHYIVRHTLVSADGEVLGEKTFYPSDEDALSVFEVKGATGTLYATSFCNKHDFWVTEFSL